MGDDKKNKDGSTSLSPASSSSSSPAILLTAAGVSQHPQALALTGRDSDDDTADYKRAKRELVFLQLEREKRLLREETEHTKAIQIKSERWERTRRRDQWTTALLIGASSAAIWLLYNAFVPSYNSFAAELFAIFYAPLLVGGLVYKLCLAVERNKYHETHGPDMTFGQAEELDAKCKWVGLTIGLSMTTAQIISKLVYFDGVSQLIEASMRGWSGTLVNGLPMEFHIGMMVAAAVGFALCFAPMMVVQKNKNPKTSVLPALLAGLALGAGLYAAYLIPGLNETFNWGLPHGSALLLSGLVNGAILTAVMGADPTFLDLSFSGPAPATKKTLRILKPVPPVATPPVAASNHPLQQVRAN